MGGRLWVDIAQWPNTPRAARPGTTSGHVACKPVPHAQQFLWHGNGLTAQRGLLRSNTPSLPPPHPLIAMYKSATIGVWKCPSRCVYVCVCVCVCVHARAHLHHLRMCHCPCKGVSVCVCVFACMLMCIYAYVCVFVCVCVCVCVRARTQHSIICICVTVQAMVCVCVCVCVHVVMCAFV